MKINYYNKKATYVSLEKFTVIAIPIWLYVKHFTILSLVILVVFDIQFTVQYMNRSKFSNHYIIFQIQKMWRGYYVRKYVFNYYSRKRYLEALQIKNEIVRYVL